MAFEAVFCATTTLTGRLGKPAERLFQVRPPSIVPKTFLSDPYPENVTHARRGSVGLTARLLSAASANGRLPVIVCQVWPPSVDRKTPPPPRKGGSGASPGRFQELQLPRFAT